MPRCLQHGDSWEHDTGYRFEEQRLTFGKWVPVVTAGVLGSLAMDLVQNGFSAAFERGRADDDRDEETEAIVSVVRRIANYVPYGLARDRPAIVGRALHYAFGSAFAIVYGAVRERRSGIGCLYGIPFGLGLWIFSDVLLIPAAHLIAPQRRYSVAERLNAVVSHVAYALTVEFVIRRADRDSP